MGWFDAAASVVGTIGGAILGAKANEDAAEQAAKAASRSTKAYREDAAKAREIYGGIQGETAAGPSYLRRVITGSTALTPQQRAEREEIQRSTLNALSSGGLRGSGRAVTAAIKDTTGDFTNRALATNMARADSAADRFAAPYFNAAGDAARTHIGEGAFAGENIYQAGMDKAGADLATGRLYGSALGDIAGLIAGEVKERSSSYPGYRRGGTVRRGGLHEVC